MKLTFPIIWSMAALVLLSGCKKDYDKSVFEKPPQDRVNEMLKDYQKTLISAPYGWVAYAYPGTRGSGTTFLFHFDSTNRVVINCDIDDETITVPKESSYRLQAMQMPTLIFDTYSYLHLLSDPNPNELGGISGRGFIADFEFYFLNVSKNKDTVWMQGAKNGMALRLVKVTDDTREDVEQGFTRNNGAGILNIKNRVDSYLPASRFYNFKMPDNKQLTMSFRGGFTVTFLYVDDKGKVIPQTTVFSHTAKGIHLRDSIKYKDQNAFIDLVWNQGNNNGLYIDGINNTCQTTTDPDFNLDQILGPMYKVINVMQPVSNDPGISTAFSDVWKKVADTLRTVYQYNLNQINFYFDITAKTMQVNVLVASTKGTAFGNHTYNFNVNRDPNTGKDIITFISHSDDAGGAVIRRATQPLLDYFETGGKRFTIDYYHSPVDGTVTQGKISSIDDPAFYFTGALY